MSSIYEINVKKILNEIENLFEKDDLRKKILAEMQKIIEKVLSGIAQRN